VFFLAYSDLISSVPQLVNVPVAGPSTPQIIAFPMICSGRDDRVEKI
jgi:hypothetical protein